jgi:orotidine-5'-phosphate decarboxylase
MAKIIERDRSVIPAADVRSLSEFQNLVSQTHDVEGIGGYKVGATLVIRHGLKALVDAARELTDLPIIYDHQKGMTDIPDMGKEFALAVKESGADAFIGFPQAGPTTMIEWTKAFNENGIGVIIGGEMTHPNYKRSEGGYIADEALPEIYGNSALNGVRDFVVPGNKPDRVMYYRSKLNTLIGDISTFYSPGLITQGGVITDAAKAAGDRWHAIIGRGIYAAKDIRAAAKEMTSQLV